MGNWPSPEQMRVLFIYGELKHIVELNEESLWEGTTEEINRAEDNNYPEGYYYITDLDTDLEVAYGNFLEEGFTNPYWFLRGILGV
jgi:hypothetical protein